jgi:hypothetical protein
MLSRKTRILIRLAKFEAALAIHHPAAYGKRISATARKRKELADKLI